MKRRTLTPDESRLWSHVTRADTPLQAPARHEAAASLRMPGHIAVRAGNEMQWAGFAPPDDGNPLACGAYAGIDRSTAERFRKGNYPIDGTLDLHGMNREKAHMALCAFIRSRYADGDRCLLVITGKGQKFAVKDRQQEPNEDIVGPDMKRGVLRDMLPQWLQEPGLKGMVLAFDAARQKHGGSGAYYILLRRKR